MFNRVTLIGRLTKDVEFKVVGDKQTELAQFTVATDTHTGKDRKETYFANCKAWGKTAEIADRFLRKGHLTAVEGRITEESWDKDGEKKTKTVIVVDKLTLMPNKKED